MVISGLGPKAGRRSNVLAGGAEEVEIGGERFRPRSISDEAGFAVLADYERRNRLLMPLAPPILSKLAGFRYDGLAPGAK